jgi:hypothetical protein
MRMLTPFASVPASAGLVEQESREGAEAMAITIYGVVAVSFMMTMYALEARGNVFIALFALGCVLSSIYGFLSGAWPFGLVEMIWAGVALRRYSNSAT